MRLQVVSSQANVNPNDIYLHFELLEEYPAGMWKTITGQEREMLLKRAIEFTGYAKEYGVYMLKAVNLWPNSCAHNLSKSNTNRQAWIGHAATCIAIKCPEDITRLAWHYLTQKQQDDANAQADIAIQTWEKQFKKGIQSCLRLS